MGKCAHWTVKCEVGAHRRARLRDTHSDVMECRLSLLHPTAVWAESVTRDVSAHVYH